MFVKGSLLYKTARIFKHCLLMLYNYSLIIGAFCLGWCSYDKMKSYIKEYMRLLNRFNVFSDKPFIIKSYNGKRILSLEEANEIIGNAIDSGKPFMAARYGNVELSAVSIVRDDGKGFTAPHKKTLNMLCKSAGFFPEDSNQMIKFAEVMKEATYQVNLIGVWFNPMEEWIMRTYGNNPEYCDLGSFEPFFTPNAWTSHLKNKRVVVIHPFEKTIQAQYKKRELLFPGKNILPEFELRTVKAVQTITFNKDERFATWFDALDYMFEETMKKDFDVAIIGCGAYGFPLAAKIKQAGKIALHLGAVTQLLFGIKGRRWENFGEAYQKMLDNSAWVRPSENETPDRWETHEGGAYW